MDEPKPSPYLVLIRPSGSGTESSHEVVPAHAEVSEPLPEHGPLRRTVQGVHIVRQNQLAGPQFIQTGPSAAPELPTIDCTAACPLSIQ